METETESGNGKRKWKAENGNGRHRTRYIASTSYVACKTPSSSSKSRSAWVGVKPGLMN